MSGPRYRKVPSARLSRLASFGQLAGGIAGGMIAEGAPMAIGPAPSLRSQQAPGAVSQGTKSELRATLHIVLKHHCGVLLEAVVLPKLCSLPRTLVKMPTPRRRSPDSWQAR